MGKISNGTFTNDEDEENSELLGSQETGEKKNCIRFKISPSVSVKHNGEHGGHERFVRKVGLMEGDKLKMRGRAEHSLFSEATRAQDNYDVEAVKLSHARQVWHGVEADKRPPSISSEETISDYEQVGGFSQEVEDGEGRVRDDINLRLSHPAPTIWEDREIETGLRNLCYITYKREDVFNVVDGGDMREMLDLAEKLKTEKLSLNPILLLSTWKDNTCLMTKLIELGGDPACRDNEGRSCLHLAANNDSVSAVRILLQHKVPLNVFDASRRATPLFCAAAIENSQCLPLLLATGADVNLGLHELGVSALLAAVRVNAVNNVNILLDAGAEPNSVVLFSETPLHTAASMGYSDCVKVLLKFGAGIEILMGQMKMSALHLAAQEGNVDCVDHLLEAGASVRAENVRGQSPLHLAALAQSPETVELLLNNGADPDCEDLDQRTPLHSAIVKGSRSYECVKMLLDARANVNHQDKFGYSPLHIAALNEYGYCANLLLCHGADITVRTNGGTTALSMIVRKIPSVLPKFEDMLDQAITLAEHDINDVDCELKLDYKVLIPNKCRGESTMFMAFIETGHNHLLKHPLCESFLHLKWLKVRKFFFVSLAFHLIFTMLHTTFVILVYSNQCIIRDNCRHGSDKDFQDISRLENHSGQSVSGDCFVPYEERCKITIETIVVWVLLIMSTAVLSAKEVFQLMHSQNLYFLNWENWVQWGIIINVVMVSFHTNPFTSLHSWVELVSRWQHHAAAIGVFLVWGELMLMVGRLPTFGIYVQMFTTVAKNFFKFLAAYFCLLVAFALSFCVLFPNYQSFNVQAVSALVKTLVMMAGEIEYENFIYENGDAIFPFTGHFMILLFVVLISIILMNLLVGLAVSDIQGLQKSAGLDRLVRQAELISHIESMLFTRLLLCLPQKFLDVLHQNALVVPHAYNWTLTIRPNDIREDRLSRDITENVHSLVSRRYQSRKRRPFSRYTARANKVRREKSFAPGSGVNVEEQLTEIRGNLINIQGENNLLKRNIEVVKGHLETLVSSASPGKKTSQPSNLSEKIQKSLKTNGASEEGDKSGVRKLVQKLRQQENPTDNESVKDLVQNLTNLALAITEDRNESEASGGNKKKLTVSASDGNNVAYRAGQKEEFFKDKKYERKFHSLDKKLKRTNLMRRRESQALLEGIRKSRQSNSNLTDAADQKEL